MLGTSTLVLALERAAEQRGWVFSFGADLMRRFQWRIPVTGAGLGRRRRRGSSLAGR
jgi:hypothetical protein